MSKQILVYLARHGTTNLNQQDAFRGPIDAPLDQQGWKDANQLAYYFKPIELSYIVSSSKKRTRDTAKQIGEGRDEPLAPTANPDLCAWNVGDLGGEPKNDANLAIVEWHVEHPNVALPGGESLNDFGNRVRPLLGEAVDLAMDCGTPVLLVVHSSIIHEAGTVLGGHHDYALVEPGGVAAIYIENGKLDLEAIFKPRETPPAGGEAVT